MIRLRSESFGGQGRERGAPIRSLPEWGLAPGEIVSPPSSADQARRRAARLGGEDAARLCVMQIGCAKAQPGRWWFLTGVFLGLWLDIAIRLAALLAQP